MPRRRHRYGDETISVPEAKTFWTEKGAKKKYELMMRMEKIHDPVTGEEKFVHDTYRTYPTLTKGTFDKPVLGKSNYWTVGWWKKKWAPKEK